MLNVFPVLSILSTVVIAMNNHANLVACLFERNLNNTFKVTSLNSGALLSV